MLGREGTHFLTLRNQSQVRASETALPGQFSAVACATCLSLLTAQALEQLLQAYQSIQRIRKLMENSYLDGALVCCQEGRSFANCSAPAHMAHGLTGCCEVPVGCLICKVGGIEGCLKL